MKKALQCHPTSIITMYFIFHITIVNANCTFEWTQGFCDGASGRFLDDEKVAYILMLEIHNSNLTSLTANDFNRLTNVNYIKIVACYFPDPPKIELFAGLKNLETLDISLSTIGGDASAIFGTNDRLEELSMSGNFFTSVKSNLSRRLPLINFIDLSYNNISDIDLDPSNDSNQGGVFSHLSSVTEINLQNNKINHVQNGTFIFLDDIKKVDLSFNMIHAIEPAALNFSSVNGNGAEIVLNISFNALWAVNKNTFYLGSRVKELDLMGNNISSLHAGAFQGLSNMKKLNLFGNTIVEVLSGVFPKNNSLERLDMGNNSILHLANRAFEELKSLKELCLENNKLIFMDNTFVPLSNLIHLNLRGNQISHVTRAFYGCPDLEVLDLSENAVSQVEAGAFAVNIRLQLLLLQRNALQSNNFDCVFLFNDSSSILHDIRHYIPARNSSGTFNNVEVTGEFHRNGRCVCVFFTGQHRDNHGSPQRYLSSDGCSIENMDNVGTTVTDSSQIPYRREQDTTVEAVANGIELHYEEITSSSTTVFTTQRTTERLVVQAGTNLPQVTYHRDHNTAANVEAITNGVEPFYEEKTSSTTVSTEQVTTERLVVQPGTNLSQVTYHRDQNTTANLKTTTNSVEVRYEEKSSSITTAFTNQPTERLDIKAGANRSLKQNPTLLSGLTAAHIAYSILSGVAIVIVIASVLCLVIKLRRSCCKERNTTFENEYEKIDEMGMVGGESLNDRWEEGCTSVELEEIPPELPPRPAIMLREITED